MRFEGREVKAYAEPVSAADLEPGVVYFALQFLDDEMLVPVLEPLIFVGGRLQDEEGNGGCLFQDAESYRAGVRFDSDNRDEGTFYFQAPEHLNHIFEFEKALDGLLGCSLRRMKARAAP